MMIVGGFIVFCFFAGGLSFSKGRKHLLSMLINLEFMVLSVFVIVLLVMEESSKYVGIFILVFSVCEGALGLTILVAMSRSFGGDYLSSFSLSF